MSFLSLARSLVRILALALVSLALLQGCGRKGPLEAPETGAAAADPAATTLLPPILGTEPAPGEPEATRNTGPDRPFILDPLL
jgi:predicted small lipoprotein YifL